MDGGGAPTRRELLGGAAVLGAAALGCPEGGGRDREPTSAGADVAAHLGGSRALPRNVLFVVVDQHRFDVSGYMGDAAAVTPNLDRLAAGATRFTGTYCQVPLCAPARQSLLTGQYAHTHTTFRNNEEHFPEGLWTLPRVLAAAGWRTALFGKTHCSTDGFGRVRELREMLEDFLAEHPDGERAGDSHYTFDKQDEEYDYVGMMNPRFERAGPAPSFFMEEAVAREASQFLAEKDARPFFCWASFVNPHPPLFPPDEFHALFEGRELPLRGDLRTADPGLLDFHAARREKQGLAALPPGALLNVTRAYYASLAWTDHCVGELLEGLERAGHADDTLVVYTSDHGEMLGQHGLLKKWAFYEAAVRVPLVVRWPGAIERTVERVVQHVDLVPTLIEALGLESGASPDPLPGRSLAPLVATGEDPQRMDLALAELAGGDELHWMLRDERYKFMHHGSDGRALFDLREDPGELRNLAGDEGQTERIAEIEARFRARTAGTTWNVRR